MNVINRFLSFLILLIFIPILSLSQDSITVDTTHTKYIKVFFDCQFSDYSYIREKINYVDYVRDTKESNIHILITRQTTGSGGQEYSIFFIGTNEFDSMDDTYKFYTEPDQTHDEIRIELTETIKAGLMRYILKTPLIKKLKVELVDGDLEIEKGNDTDPWKNWVFDISLNGHVNGEESIKSNYLYSNVSINKINEDQKFNFSYYSNINQTVYKLDDTTTLENITTSNSLYILWVKSLGEHWSVGLTSSAYSSTFRNTKFKASFYPALEYNIFPYSESNERQLRILYKIGYNHVQYIDTTIFNKIEENLFLQNISLSFDMIKKWGAISTSINASNYFHDFSKNNLNIWSNLRIRVFKGFSVNFYGQFSFIHDQLYLLKTDVSTEEILLRKRQLATQYSYFGSFGLSYTFGSIYNNIVNPRFGD